MSNQTELLGPPETLPMQDRRPGWLTSHIDERFATLRTQDNKPGYNYNGEVEEYHFTHDLSSTDLIKQLERTHGDALRILDIGAASGGLVLNSARSGHLAQALSAHDYRRHADFQQRARQLDAQAYMVGDANRLASIPELHDSYDLIVSQLTFIHLIDTLGTLEQAANKVASGGILAIMSIDIGESAFYKQRQHSAVTAGLVLDGLQKGGFDTADSFIPDEHSSGIPALIGRRISDETPVRLAVGYEGDAESWRYTWGARYI